MTNDQQPGLLTILAKGASVALVVQVLGIGLTYLAQVLLARWMQVTEYGAYEYAITWGEFLSFFAGLGLPRAILRFIPEYTVKEDWAHLRGILWSSWRRTLLSSTIAAIVATGLVLVLDRTQGIPHLAALVLGIWTVPLQALMKLQVEMVRAGHRIGLAYAPFLIMVPGLLIIGAFTWQQTGQPLTSTGAVTLFTLAMFAIVSGQLWMFQRDLPDEMSGVQPAYDSRQWLVVALPMLMMDGAHVLLDRTDLLMIGALIGTAQVGIYSAAFKTAMWVHFPLFAINAIAAPLFARLYAQGDRQSLQRVVSTVAHWMFWVALLITIGLIAFAEPVLSLFGSEFIAAKWVMIALALGQLVNVASGSVGYLLMMTGYQNQCAIVFGVSAVLNVILNAITIPIWGSLGAALATAFSMMLWNLWLYRLVVRYLNVRPSIIAAIAFWWRERSA